MKKALVNRYKLGLGMVGALASTMLFVYPLHAQDSPLSLADRVTRLEQQSKDQGQGGIGLVNQIQQLQAQIQQQQGQIEELQHQLQDLQDKSKAQYTDLDSRLGRLESGGAAAANPPPATAGANPAATKGKPPAGSAPAAAGTTAAPPPSAADAQAAYGAAFNALRGGDYVSASRSFRAFIQQYPNDALTPNAYYWLGESYYVTMNYPVALDAFQHLLSQFPQSEKAPDALLKVGYSQIELKQIDAAKATLNQVLSKYPGSKAAGLAQERLRRLQSPTGG